MSFKYIQPLFVTSIYGLLNKQRIQICRIKHERHNMCLKQLDVHIIKQNLIKYIYDRQDVP